MRAKLRARDGASRASGRVPTSAVPAETPATLRDGTTRMAFELNACDIVVVGVGEVIPGDGVVIDGIGLVEESAITGESAPVIREPGTDRSAVCGGARVTSGQLFVEIT
jgi:K+-transporting ATPase ATPase B chain